MIVGALVIEIYRVTDTRLASDEMLARTSPIDDHRRNRATG